MKEQFGIYLAGACRDLPDEGKTWRKDVKEYFEDYGVFFSEDCKNLKIYDPTKYFARDGSNTLEKKQVKRFCLKHIIKNCDVVLVNLNNSNYSVGTGCELQYAECHEIPIIGFGKKDVYEWFPDYCDVVFDEMQDALDYIIDFYM